MCVSECGVSEEEAGVSWTAPRGESHKHAVWAQCKEQHGLNAAETGVIGESKLVLGGLGSFAGWKFGLDELEGAQGKQSELMFM